MVLLVFMIKNVVGLHEKIFIKMGQSTVVDNRDGFVVTFHLIPLSKTVIVFSLYTVNTQKLVKGRKRKNTREDL